MKRYFVTGTDTGVGKTFVTGSLARRARELGLRSCALKPIETGCSSSSALGEDQLVLVEAAGGWQRGELAGIYQFKRPVAPFVAALSEGRTIDLGRVESVVRSIEADVVIVEGAGGWRVPITETQDMSALALRLQMPVIVVARAGLGTINHSLLTIEAIERDGCTIAAVVLSKLPTDETEFVESNREQIRRRWAGNVMVLGELPSVLDDLLPVA